MVYRAVFWLFSILFVLAGLAVAFRWFTNELQVSVADQVAVGRSAAAA